MILVFLFVSLSHCQKREVQPVIVSPDKTGAEDGGKKNENTGGQQQTNQGNNQGNNQGGTNQENNQGNSQQGGSQSNGQAGTESGGSNTTVVGDGIRKVNGLTVTAPQGWAIKQEAVNDGIVIVGFGSGEKYFTIYSKKGSAGDIKSIFVNDSKVLAGPTTATIGAFQWNIVETTKESSGQGGNGTSYVAAFMLENNGYSFYGFSRGKSSEEAKNAVETFLKEIK